MPTDHGWISYSPGNDSHVSDEVRASAQARIQERQERRGALLAIVQVRVFEHGEQAQVTFPPDALLGPETLEPFCGYRDCEKGSGPAAASPPSRRSPDT